MKSFRIHATRSVEGGRIPYLLLEFLGGGKVAADFQLLKYDQNDAFPEVQMSTQDLYEMLEGKEIVVPGEDGTLTFCVRGDELKIVREALGSRAEQEFHLWAAEVSLAWNMLGWA